jgi:hypothetical protein
VDNDIINISDSIEVHPSSQGWKVVRSGSVYGGPYSDREYAVELARELAEEVGEQCQ